MNDYTDAIEGAYSFKRPAYIVGQALMQGMIAGGLTEAEALSLLYSKAYRWALDFSLGDSLRRLAIAEGERLAREYHGHEWTRYDLPQHALVRELKEPAA
jgi:hypothetical protein